MQDSRSFRNHKSLAGLSILAIFGVGICCGAVVTLLLSADHDTAIRSGSSIGRILSANSRRLEEDKEAKRRLHTPSDSAVLEDSAHAEHSGSHGNATDSHGEHERHGYLSLFFLLGTITLGCILQVLQERIFTCVPYTCLLFFTGILIAVMHWLRVNSDGATGDNLHKSVDMWENIDPHLIFYIFLPALIFAEAMKMKIKLFGRLLKQVLVLAGPGVLMGTALTAVLAKSIFQNWDWNVSLIFGSILAATDPVAVVALFNTLGVSPRLTMLVSGESLINDGTAIVIFTLLLPQVCERIDVEHEGTWGVILAVLRLTVVAVVVGAVIAIAFLIIIFGTASSGYHSDAMIQVAVTICCAFLSFFLAETEMSTSGVLCVVSSGLVFAYTAWPRFANRETIHTVWEFIEFVGNTVIFMLAGLLFGDKCTKFLLDVGHALDWSDIGRLFIIYVGATAIRALMLALFCPILNCVGQRITWQEMLVIVWSGLRGAVGLVLAIIVDLEFNAENTEEKKKQGAEILFHVGGMAMLTVGINAPLAAPLLRRLGLTRPPLLEDEVTCHFERALNDKTNIELQNLSTQPWFKGFDHDLVSELVPPLDKDGGHDLDFRERISNMLERARAKTKGTKLTRLSNCKAPLPHKKERYREIFMRAVQHHYWEDIEGGVVNRTSKVARILLYSTDHCLDEADKELNDWDILQEMLERTFTFPMVSKVWHTLLPHCQMLEHLFPSPASVTLWKVYASLSYIKAHQEVRKLVQEQKSLPEDSVLDEHVQEAVHDESRKQEAKANNYLKDLPPEAVEHGKSRMLAGRLLHKQIEEVRKWKNDGFLSDKGAAHILHMIQESQRENELLFYDPTDKGDSHSEVSEEEDEEVLVPLSSVS